MLFFFWPDPESLIVLTSLRRADVQQDGELLGPGTPPMLLRQNSLGRPPSSLGRHADDENSLRRRAVKVVKKNAWAVLSV